VPRDGWQRRVAILKIAMLVSRPMSRATGSARRTQGILGGRSEQVVRRVLDAALVELARSGYTGFRMDGVASRAGVNKTTIYRRWPNRAALIAALVDRMRTPLRESPLPDTGQVESDLVAAFTRRFSFGRKIEGRAWARLLDERARPEVAAIIGDAVTERRDQWRSMVTRGIRRGELPRGTDAQLLLELVRAVVDSRSPSRRLDTTWLTLAVRTIVAGARAGTLVRDRRRQDRRARAQHRRARVTETARVVR
jgi:AcrR family transcriptional regulator